MKILVMCSAILLFAATCFGAPFLKTDPVPAGSVDYYEVTIDGNTTQETPHDNGDGTIQLKYDLAGIADGNHNATVAAGNLWGLSNAIPFDFTSGVPSDPSGIGLSAN